MDQYGNWEKETAFEAERDISKLGLSYNEHSDSL